MLTSQQKENTIALCQQLVRCTSLSGNEKEAVSALQQYMQYHGFSDIYIDEYGSITGCIKGNSPGAKILLDGHLDTVPVAKPEAWTQSPFGAERTNGKIYGRGTTDMKGAVAAMASAAAYFAERTSHHFGGKIYVSGVVHEECFEGIAARAISQRIKPDFVIIGEPSGLDLKIGQRGRAEIVVETHGKPAHSALPHNGINAVYMLCQLIQALEKIIPPQDSILGAGVSVLTDIISTPYPGASVVPSSCRATYDRRLLVNETLESVLLPYQQVIQHLEKTITNFSATAGYAIGIDTCYTGKTILAKRFFPGWCATSDDPHVKKALTGLAQAGIQASIACYPFCTNGSHYAGEAKIPTVGFGPSYEHLAHTTDEFIEETQLIKATEGYIGICQSFLNPG